MTRATALAALLLFPVVAGAQNLAGRADSTYTWRGALPARALLTVRNINGPITVQPAPGGEVELRAEKRTGRGGAIQDVAFDVRTASNGDVTICSTFRRHDPCENDGRWSDDDDEQHHDPDVTVAMTVLVPRGAEVKVLTGNGAVSVERVGGQVQAVTGNGRVNVTDTEGAVRVTTGNGAVEVRGARAAVRVHTGNGDVNVATASGPVEVRTGNGNIDVRMSAVRASEDMTFSTGSGSVRLALPASYNGELDASTGNGTVRSDFDLKVKGRLNPRRVRATIGDGGPLLRLATGNGLVEVTKAR